DDAAVRRTHDFDKYLSLTTWTTSWRADDQVKTIHIAAQVASGEGGAGSRAGLRACPSNGSSGSSGNREVDNLRERTGRAKHEGSANQETADEDGLHIP